MWKAVILAVSIASMAVGATAQTRQVAGVVTKIEQGQLQIRTDHQESISISLSPETRAVKWIMAKPWEQDPHLDIRALQVGDRVRVELAPDRPQMARAVWVVVGRPGVHR